MTKKTPFWIGCGDIHDAPERLAEIPNIAEAEAVFVSGDLTTAHGAAVAQQVVEKMQTVHPRIFAQIGNMDDFALIDWLEEKQISLHRNVLECTPEFGVMGVGCSSTTPFATPCEAPEETLGQWLRETHAKAGDWKNLLLVTHDTPRDTAVDALPNGMHVGSQAVREFIETAQPTVCLCGHIHEARGTDMLGETLVCNPGMLADGGYVEFRLVDGVLRAELKVL